MFHNIIGAINGSADFRARDGLMPVSNTRRCTGIEARFDECPSADYESTCGSSDNAYIVCQGTAVAGYSGS